MIHGLRKKFILITMLLVSLVLLAVLAGIILYYSNNLKQESYRALEMALERRMGEKEPHFEIGGKIPEDFAPNPQFVVEVAGDGTASLVSATRIEVGEESLQKIATQVLEGGNERGILKDYNLRYLMQEKNGTTKIAFVELSAEKGQIRSVVISAALMVLGAFIVFLVASLLLARWALRPVEQAWQRQRQFTADASHELKTPLTVILANTGILKAHPGKTVGEQIGWIENTEQEAKRMKGLVDDMLFLAKGDDTKEHIPMQRVNLSDVATTTALAFESVAYEQGIAIDLHVEPEVTVSGNEGQLKQLIQILLDNAVKYAEPDSAVWLRLKKRQGQAELEIYNKGKPISPEDEQHIFERFYRADPSRAEEGYGLGLSIAQSITESHKGRIMAGNKEGLTVFSVQLPAE